MLGLARLHNLLSLVTRHRAGKRAEERTPPARRLRLGLEELEGRIVPTLLGQQLFPTDYPWNQNISTAPVASNSAAIIAHIGAAKVHPDWGEDSAANGSDPLYGVPVNIVHGNSPSVAKINIIIDNYPDESDILAVPIPANALVEGDYQNGPNMNGAGYNDNQRGDSHLIIWDEDNNIAYELYGVTRPGDPTLFPDDDTGAEAPHTDGKWHAAQETVWNMNTNSFRRMGDTSADAAGLSILAGLARPDEGLPTSQGGQGAIDHALRFTLPSGDVSPQYIYPASHVVGVSAGTTKLPFGSRLRLQNNATVNALIAKMGPEAQIVAHAMQQYGLVLADIGTAMYVTGSSASADANNNITLVWNMDDVLGLSALTANNFDVVDLSPRVTGLGATSGQAGNTITVTGQNFSGSAGHLGVLFGTTPATSVTYIDDGYLSVVVPSGTGTVDIRVQSGVNATDPNNPAHDVTNPVFGYGISATSVVDQFTFGAGTAQPTINVVSGSAHFASAAVASGKTDVLTIVVKNSAGAALAGLTNASFSFGLTGGTSAGTFGPVSETATLGTYTTTFTGTTAGTVSTLTITVGGVDLAVQPTIQVSHGTLSAANSTVAFSSGNVIAGNADIVTLVLKDATGNAITGLASLSFTFALSGGTSAGSFSAVTETATKGTYTATFTPKTAGTVSTLTATVSGIALTLKPTIQITPGLVSAASKVSFAASSVVAGKADILTLVLKDAYGNAITGLADSAFGFALGGGTSDGTFGAVTETATKGAYTVAFTGITAGTASTLTTTVAGVALATKPTTQVKAGAVSAANSTVAFASANVWTGNTDAVALVLKDSFGNAVTGLYYTTFHLALSGGTSAGTFSSVTETATKGTYTATFTAKTAGTVSTLTATVSSIVLATNSTVQIATPPPGTVSGAKSTAAFAVSAIYQGSTDKLTIAVKDASGIPITGLSASDFGFIFVNGATWGTFATVTESSTKGTYYVLFTGDLPGTAQVKVSVQGVILNSLPTVTIVKHTIFGFVV